MKPIIKFKKFNLFIVPTFLVLLVIGCGSQEPTPAAVVSTPVISEPKVGAPAPQQPGEEIGISVDVSSGSGVALNYIWNADGGEIVRGQGSPAITYRVPDEPGTYNVRVTIEWDGQSVEKVTSVKVEAEATETPTPELPTETPTPEPPTTNTPTQKPTNTPESADTPTPVEEISPPTLESPTDTPTPKTISTPKPTNIPEPTPSPTEIVNIDTLVGTWEGMVQSTWWEDGKEVDWVGDTVITIKKSCKIGTDCGILNFPTFPCSIKLSLIAIEGETFQFRRKDVSGGCAFDAQDTLQPLADDMLLYIGKGDNWEQEGLLKKTGD